MGALEPWPQHFGNKLWVKRIQNPMTGTENNICKDYC